MDNLWDGILGGLKQCQAVGKIPETVGIDTWAVDYVLLDAVDAVIGDAVAYRDNRTEGMKEYVNAVIPADELYSRTGIQYQTLNTIYLPMVMKREDPEQLQIAKWMLMIPEYFNFKLTGVKQNEYTNATSTNLVNAEGKCWDREIISKLGLPNEIFHDLAMPGTVLGNLLPEIQADVGFDTTVILPATHDTGSAFLAVPAKDDNAVYLSSGTWSLFGAEMDKPDLSPEAAAAGFSNEGTIQGTFRPLNTIIGMWIIQECRRDWVKNGNNISWDGVVQEALKAEPLRSIINPDSPEFYDGGNMEKKIQEFCRRTGQPVPETVGQVARCVYESLALKYRNALEGLEKMKGQRIDSLNIVGGAINNRFLDQLIADSLDRRVVTGPVEGAAIGNLLTQAMALGDVRDLNHLRQVVRNSEPVEVWEPNHTEKWEEAYQKLLTFLKK